jgi:hypothetical protein
VVGEGYDLIVCILMQYVYMTVKQMQTNYGPWIRSSPQKIQPGLCQYSDIGLYQLTTHSIKKVLQSK